MRHIISDACQVNNGGCDSNAICSHDGSTNEVICTCKVGYTNTGSESRVNCTGMYFCVNNPRQWSESFPFLLTDSCLVSNGGCDVNADCSHDTTTNAVKCTCKTGYVSNTAGTTPACIGT